MLTTTVHFFAENFIEVVIIVIGTVGQAKKAQTQKNSKKCCCFDQIIIFFLVFRKTFELSATFEQKSSINKMRWDIRLIWSIG